MIFLGDEGNTKSIINKSYIEINLKIFDLVSNKICAHCLLSEKN